MRILLIVPTHKYKEDYPVFLSVSDFPTGYGYIASSLSKAGHQVVGLNLNNITGYKSAYQMVYNKIDEALQRWKPNLIGIGGLCTDYAFIKDAMMVCRKFAPCTPIVLGGGIINNDAEFVFNLLKPDFCIIGEAEETIVKLADMLQSGKNDFESIDNLGYWREN